MTLVASMTSLKDALISANLTGIDADNCVVEDEGVFNNILLRDDDDYRRALIVGYDGMRRKGNSEFGGTLLCWNLTVTAFVLLWGDVEERTNRIQDALGLVDEIFQAINDNSTLGNEVMDTMIVAAEPPLLYERQQMNDYMMLVLHLDITENLD